jgi:hypothetical protein
LDGFRISNNVAKTEPEKKATTTSKKVFQINVKQTPITQKTIYKTFQLG